MTVLALQTLLFFQNTTFVSFAAQTPYIEEKTFAVFILTY